MRVAFVGVKRKYQELPKDYRDDFTQFHLELPWYYAQDGMEVTLTTVDHSGHIDVSDSGQLLFYVEENDFGKSVDQHGRHASYDYDVVIHWRKWFPEFYRPEAINVINCQDHSFSPEWKNEVIRAYAEQKLYGILCFPTWHKRNIYQEFDRNIDCARLIDGLTLGVDTDVYQPAPDKDPYQLLWASDPGRGLSRAVDLAIKLFRLDRRYRLHVCYPDYCRGIQKVYHPAVVWHGNVSNGPALRELFNRCGVLPYTSTFMEPSSRAHRQAMAAGSLVFYPPGMGSPSELIEHMKTGAVTSVERWPGLIDRFVNDGTWQELGSAARDYAVAENWPVQARRFREYFEPLIGRDR